MLRTTGAAAFLVLFLGIFTTSCGEDQPGGNGATSNSPLPTLTFGAQETSIPSGGTTTLNWWSTDATSCLVVSDNRNEDNWVGGVPLIGHRKTPALSRVTTYTISCNGPGGAASASTTIVIMNDGGSDFGSSSGGSSSGGSSSGGSHKMYNCGVGDGCVQSPNGIYTSPTCNNMCGGGPVNPNP